MTILNPRRDFSLREGEHRDAHHIDSEDDEHLQYGEEEKRHPAHRRQIGICSLKQR
jgi:hypothetical protein